MKKLLIITGILFLLYFALQSQPFPGFIPVIMDTTNMQVAYTNFWPSNIYQGTNVHIEYRSNNIRINLSDVPINWLAAQGIQLGTNAGVIYITNLTDLQLAAVGALVTHNGTIRTNVVLNDRTNSYQLKVNPFTKRLQWVHVIIEDSFDTGSIYPWGALQYTGLGADSVVSGYAPTTREGRNGFSMSRTWGTNTLGGGHYASRSYPNVANYRIPYNNIFETEIVSEYAATNNLIQTGFKNVNNSSNVTLGVFWEFNPACNTNWVAKCIGSASLYWTSTLPANLVGIWNQLGFEGNTNSMVFYTNRVPCWTNTDSTTMPSGLGFWGISAFNGVTNPANFQNRFYENYFHVYEY